MSDQASDNAAPVFGDFGRDNLPEPSVAYHEVSEGELNAMRQGADIVRVGVGPQPFNASTSPAASRVMFYEHGLLTIDGVSSTVTDVSVSFSAEPIAAMPAPIVSPLTVTFESEVDTAAFEAFMAMMPEPTWPQWLRVEYAGCSALAPIFKHDTRETLEYRIAEAIRRMCPFTACRTVKLCWPRWRWLRIKRRAKAKAKRAKMRAARYAARWEQAHLRGEK